MYLFKFIHSKFSLVGGGGRRGAIEGEKKSPDSINVIQYPKKRKLHQTFRRDVMKGRHFRQSYRIGNQDIKEGKPIIHFLKVRIIFFRHLVELNLKERILTLKKQNISLRRHCLL